MISLSHYLYANATTIRVRHFRYDAFTYLSLLHPSTFYVSYGGTSRETMVTWAGKVEHGAAVRVCEERGCGSARACCCFGLHICYSFTTVSGPRI